jgi:surface polysaccharide O-acyltransferase-like enzyme
MDQFSYLSVLISIILGLGITQLVTGLGRLIQVRHRVTLYTPSLGWVALLLVVHVQTWWSMFGLRNQREWSFGQFFMVLLQPLVLSLLAALVLPDINADTHANLRENYFAQSRWFFSMMVVLLVVSLTKDVVLSGSLPQPLNVGAHVVFIAVSVAAAITRREWYHRVLAPFALLLMVAYIALLFARLN